MTPRIFAVIVTYNGERWIKKCIDSLCQSSINTHIIVVDNASTDNTVSIIREYDDVILFVSDENLGFGSANNIGLRYCMDNDAEYVLLLNQDAFVAANAIECLYEAARNKETVGAVTPLHLNYQGDDFDPIFFGSYLARYCKPYLRDLYFKNVESSYPIKSANAACWLVSRRCLEEVGGFDPLFFMYGEDDDFSNRIYYHELQFVLVPKALLFHARGFKNSFKISGKKFLKYHSNRVKSEAILILKNPNFSFPSNILNLLNSTVIGLSNACFRDRYPLGVLARLLGIFKVLPLLIRIYESYKKSKFTHGAFLN